MTKSVLLLAELEQGMNSDDISKMLELFPDISLGKLGTIYVVFILCSGYHS